MINTILIFDAKKILQYRYIKENDRPLSIEKEINFGFSGLALIETNDK